MCEYVRTPEVPLRKSRACERSEHVGNTSPRVAGAPALKDTQGPGLRPPRRGSTRGSAAGSSPRAAPVLPLAPRQHEWGVKRK